MKNKYKKNQKRTIIVIVLLILIIILVILSFGWFINTKKRAYIEKNEITKKLNEINEKIKTIVSIKEKIEYKIKKLYFCVRLGIGIILIFLNYFYNSLIIGKFDLGEILNFNGAILLIYSFLAYITYGSLDAFIAALKNKVSYILKKPYFSSLQEYDFLINEKAFLEERLRKINDADNQKSNLIISNLT